MSPRALSCALALAAALLAAGAAGALTVDGHLDPEYGPALATQTNGWYGTDDDLHLMPYRNLTALDVLYAYVSPDAVLHVFVGGVLRDWISAIDPAPEYDDLYLFIDDQPGGQSVLLSDGSGNMDFPTQAGVRFDAGFEPDVAFQMQAPQLAGAGPAAFFVEGSQYALTASGSTGTFLGRGTGAAPGLLSGGTNPFDIRLAIDNTDTTGVPGNCAPGSGAGVTSGVEWAIPLAAIGSPSGCMRLMVYAAFQWGSFTLQSLPPVPPGPCTFVPASSLDFSALAGDQFVTLCPTSVPARTSTWGSLKSRYR